jgi:hypothetical protein
MARNNPKAEKTRARNFLTLTSKARPEPLFLWNFHIPGRWISLFSLPIAKQSLSIQQALSIRRYTYHIFPKPLKNRLTTERTENTEKRLFIRRRPKTVPAVLLLPPSMAIKADFHSVICGFLFLNLSVLRVLRGYFL